jgi:hypothetical protein
MSSIGKHKPFTNIKRVGVVAIISPEKEFVAVETARTNNILLFEIRETKIID